MVSWRDGWSNHEILSVTSVSPRSSKEALDARFVFAGLTLYDPLDVDTACLKILYWAAEILLLSPLSPSSSEMSLLDSGSIAAVKLTGDSSRAGDSTDEDLDSGERDLDSLDSLRCLTGVLACLTGVLAFLSGTLARLRKELTVFCGEWRLGYSLWSSSRRGWSPVGWVMSGSRRCWLVRRTGWSNWNTGLVHPTL